MTGLKTAVAFGLVLTVGGWLASGVVARRTPDGIPRQQSLPDARSVGQAANDIRVRLQRLSNPERSPSYSAPARNPFRFDQREPGADQAAAKLAAADLESLEKPEPAAPHMQLAGIAEDQTAAGLVRRAVISAEGGVSIVGEGDRLLGRFRVLRVSATAVELDDELAAGRLVLTLK